MLKSTSFSFLLDTSSFLQSGRCLGCQFRNAPLNSRSLRRYYANKNSPGNEEKQAPSAAAEEKTQVAEETPSAEPIEGENPNPEFIPKPLDHPLGLVYPPQEWQNTGIDTRTLRQRRDDFVDYEKHIQRRKELTRQVSKPYFREWTNMQYHEGKTFLSPARLFKRDAALYFPNMFGITLTSPSKALNTTPLLRGKVSIVSLFSSVWAETQVATFLGPKQNPRLHEILASENRLAQKVDINLEENALKAWIVRMFMWSMRRKLPKEQHDKYFLVRKGFDEGLKEAVGMMNSKVGYVYLLDENCRIRWAGSGPAEEEELDALNNGLLRLIAEKKKSIESTTPAAEWASTKQGSSASPRPRVVSRV
ncbi:F1F0 ATP synthase assembly protein Atp10, putative [Paecilomyces variotii No. 5]|uniref:F1F0 ATP synthase assembly protein Atp10, putative n=1 Tax=Byssochlamys spectabilis (strain No. 5 / NBRC 109023) TaxID=1356009 RepID=V5GDQ4_BYSSN|nr:F1F0 ATP synthase assembly protein Atp10, putative [Paecilomyces variotii No. 5]